MRCQTAESERIVVPGPSVAMQVDDERQVPGRGTADADASSFDDDTAISGRESMRSQAQDGQRS